MRLGDQAGTAISRSRAYASEPKARLQLTPTTVDRNGTGVDTRRYFPEIDCVRALLSSDTLRAAEDHAATISVGAEGALIVSDALSEERARR